MRRHRAALRLLVLVGIVLTSLPSALVGRSPARRARWLQRASRRALRLLGARVRVHGTAPATGLVVSNHLSYLDVLVLSAALPAVFVAKDDVRRWPVVGWLCALARTIFVDRRRRMRGRGSLEEVRAVLDAGVPVVLFPEGTSSGGASVLPFKTMLLAAAADHVATPAAVRYTLPGGCAAEELCYWRDMTFAPHCWHVLGLRGFNVELSFGSSHPATADRKALAASLHKEISSLQTSGSAPPRASGGRIWQPPPANAKLLPGASHGEKSCSSARPCTSGEEPPQKGSSPVNQPSDHASFATEGLRRPT